MSNWILFGFAALCLILVPFTPALVRLRIRFFRWIHWDWAVNVLERYFERWVLLFRAILLVIAAVLIYIGLE